jgi:coenzyme PQQ precursor peptide PqqA
MSIIRELKERTMEWTSPQFEEVCLNCEINSYASAEL